MGTKMTKAKGLPRYIKTKTNYGQNKPRYHFKHET
jgi:hypothetical protein